MRGRCFATEPKHDQLVRGANISIALRNPHANYFTHDYQAFTTAGGFFEFSQIVPGHYVMRASAIDGLSKYWRLLESPKLVSVRNGAVNRLSYGVTLVCANECEESGHDDIKIILRYSAQFCSLDGPA